MQKPTVSIPTSPNADSTDVGATEESPLSPTQSAAICGGGGTTSEIKPVSETLIQGGNDLAATANNWSSGLQQVLDQPPATFPLKLLLGGMVFCLAFSAWAWLGKIEEVGRARGELVPQGEVYKIHPVESGKVINISIQEGEAVKAGQMLVELDNEIVNTEVARLQQLLSSYKVELSQKRKLINKTRLEATSRMAIASADVEAQKAVLAQAKANADTRRKLLTQLQADIAAHQARQKRLEPFVKEGVLARDYLFEVEQTVRDRQRAITENQGELQQALVEATRIQAELIQKQAEATRTQLETQQRIQQLEIEITELRAKIDEAKHLLDTAKAKLVQRFLYAPVNGFVSSLNINNIGEVVQPGQTIAELAPHGAPLILSASLPNQEAGFIKSGMSVQVKLDAYPYQDFGSVTGKVISVSPDSKPDEKLGAVYRVKVALERNYVTESNQMIYFKAGQTATADIIIRRRSIADILLKPIKELQKGGINM